MAAIDLRNATIRIKDGYLLTGKVNNVSGYAAAATVVAIDNMVGAVVVGDPVTFATHKTIYKITAHTETSTNTTSITITPGLVDALVDEDDVTVGPHSLNVKLGEGNLTYSEKRNVSYVLDRGNLDTVKLGADVPLEAKLDFTWEFLKGDTNDPPTIEDALKKRGNASTWITSASDVCEPYAVDIEIEYNPPCTGEKREIITLADFRYEDLAHDIKASTVSVNGKCNIKEASIVRVT